MKSRNILDSFNYAISGIIYSVRTQRNLKIHSAAALCALFLSLFYDFTKLELLVLLSTITIVFVAELINTSIEKVVDLVVDTYHPLAKIAKDVAAGAVLLAAANSLVVAYILFLSKPPVFNTTMNVFIKVRQTPLHIAFICIIIVVILILLIKARYNSGTPLHGGVVSGHSAIAFSITTIICFLTQNPIITTLSLFMSLLVGQSRIEGKIHTVLQVAMGAVVGITVTVFIFSLTSYTNLFVFYP